MIHFNVEMRTDFSEIQKQILKIPKIIFLVRTLVETDLFAIVPIPSFEEFFRLKDILQTTKGIKEIQFDLDYLFSLSIQESFQLMFNRNRELLDIL